MQPAWKDLTSTQEGYWALLEERLLAASAGSRREKMIGRGVMKDARTLLKDVMARVTAAQTCRWEQHMRTL